MTKERPARRRGFIVCWMSHAVEFLVQAWDGNMSGQRKSLVTPIPRHHHRLENLREFARILGPVEVAADVRPGCVLRPQDRFGRSGESRVVLRGGLGPYDP